MDIEAYKLLTKICLKQQETEEIISVLETRLEKEDNGDLYYVLAQVYKYIGDTEAYAEFLEDALQNSLTLTFPKKSVEEEYAAISAVLDEEEEFESEETEEDEADEDEADEDEEKDSDDDEQIDDEDEDDDENFEEDDIDGDDE